MRDKNFDTSSDFREEELNTAAAAVREAMHASLEAPDAEEHVFSEAFLQKMEPLLTGSHRHPHKTALRRVAAVFLVVLLGTGVWLGVDAPARAGVLSWTRIEYAEQHMIYRFSGELPQAELPVFAPGWLPEGMVKEKESTMAYHAESTPIRISHYHDESTGAHLKFEYYYMDDGLTVGVRDFTGRETVTIGRLRGDYYPGAGGKNNDLVWMDDGRDIAFSLSSTLDRETMLKVAEHVEQRLAFPCYLPTWTPEEMTAFHQHVTEARREISFRSDSSLGFTLSCYRRSEPRDTTFVPKDAVWERVKVRRMEGIFYADTSNRVRKLNYLIWTDEKNDTEFCIMGNYDLDTLLKIAKHIRAQ